MQQRHFTRGVGVGLIVLVLAVACEAQQRRTKAPDVRHRSANPLQQSSGEYSGHRWRIDQDHALWWDGKPYVRFAFTGNGDLEAMRRLGFTQFTLMPDEAWAISGPQQAIPRSLDEATDRLEAAGATYYAALNAFWPWKYGKLIADADKAAALVRDVVDVTAHAGRRESLKVVVRMPIHRAEQEQVKVVRTYALLFDLQKGTNRDISGKVQRVEAANVARPQRSDDVPGAWGWYKTYGILLDTVAFPDSRRLRLVVGMDVLLDEVPNTHGLPPLWKPGIREFYRTSLNAFRSAYAKTGLRGMIFADEINTSPVSLLTSRAYPDIRRDEPALRAYREWLKRRFGSVHRLNAALGSHHKSFEELKWVVPLHPFTEADILDPDSDAPLNDVRPWDALRSTYGLFESKEQFRKVSDLQDEFRQWFYGHWLAEYAKQAKQIIGDVPVFTCSASIPGEADRYLGIHRWALHEGVDGLTRNYYGGHLDEEEKFTLRSLAKWMKKVQVDSGRTKHLWANEIGYVRVGATDADLEDVDRNLPFGVQWAFPSKKRLRQTLTLLRQNGYRGFNRFLMNPSASGASQELRWMAELRGEFVNRPARSKRE